MRLAIFRLQWIVNWRYSRFVKRCYRRSTAKRSATGLYFEFLILSPHNLTRDFVQMLATRCMSVISREATRICETKIALNTRERWTKTIRVGNYVCMYIILRLNISTGLTFVSQNISALKALKSSFELLIVVVSLREKKYFRALSSIVDFISNLNILLVDLIILVCFACSVSKSRVELLCF